MVVHLQGTESPVLIHEVHLLLLAGHLPQLTNVHIHHVLLHTPLILKHAREDIHVDIIHTIGIVDAVRSGAYAV